MHYWNAISYLERTGNLTWIANTFLSPVSRPNRQSYLSNAIHNIFMITNAFVIIANKAHVGNTGQFHMSSLTDS